MKLFKKKIITRGDNNEAYLVRYSIPWLTCKWFAVKIHNILLSDDACQHSHPWAFLSIILWGGYVEHRTVSKPNVGYQYGVGKKTNQFKIARVFNPGSVLWRPKNTIHRLQLLENKGKPVTAWTMVITFKKVQDWGFYTPNGYVDHREYKDNGGCQV